MDVFISKVLLLNLTNYWVFKFWVYRFGLLLTNIIQRPEKSICLCHIRLDHMMSHLRND